MTEDEVFAKYLREAARHVLGRDPEPDEDFMRGVENCIDIPEQSADDFRRMIFSQTSARMLVDRLSFRAALDSQSNLKNAAREYADTHPDDDIAPDAIVTNP